MTKKRLQGMSPEALAAEYPLQDATVAGWRFRCREASCGHYVAEGCDPWGRIVSRESGDPDILIASCVEDARLLSKNT